MKPRGTPDPVHAGGRPVFVTGTDTGVGKTVVTAALAAWARSTGQTVVALKPVASGVEPGTFGEDAERISAAAGHPPLVAHRFIAPLSPHLAAEREGVEVDRAALVAWVLASVGSFTLVEGAGGWEVPIRRDWRMSDFAHDLDADVLIVAQNRLGVLNHSLLTVGAVRAGGCRLLGVVLTPSARGGEDDESTASNAEEIRRLLGVMVAEMPRIDPDDPVALQRAGVRVAEALLAERARPHETSATPGSPSA